MHSCLTPVSTVNQSPTVSFHFTKLCLSSYKFDDMMMSSGIPYLFMMHTPQRLSVDDIKGFIKVYEVHYDW